MNYGKIGKMKYIEELEHGDCFSYNNQKFLLTADFKSSGDRLCYNLINGSSSWMKSNSMVDVCPIYTLDDNNNISPVKQTKNVSHQTQNLS